LFRVNAISFLVSMTEIGSKDDRSIM
jgi:hypothetical protein